MSASTSLERAVNAIRTSMLEQTEAFCAEHVDLRHSHTLAMWPTEQVEEGGRVVTRQTVAMVPKQLANLGDRLDAGEVRRAGHAVRVITA